MLLKLGTWFEVEYAPLAFTFYLRMGRRAVFLSRGDCSFDVR